MLPSLNASIKSLYNEDIRHNLTTINGNGNSTKLEHYYTEVVSTSHSTKQGYTFAGYTIDPSNLSYTSIANGNIQFNMPDRDVKLTEKWNKIPISSVTLNITSPLTVSLGEATRKLTATINPSTVYPMPSVTYSSNNACVAIDANGNMTFKSLGSATITATANDGSGKKATIVVNVKQYTLTVYGSNAGGSSGAGKYNKGQTVTINAGAPAADKKFVRWDKSANITLANANSATTTFVFPGADCNVSAVWARRPDPQSFTIDGPTTVKEFVQTKYTLKCNPSDALLVNDYISWGFSGYGYPDTKFSNGQTSLKGVPDANITFGGDGNFTMIMHYKNPSEKLINATLDVKVIK